MTGTQSNENGSAAGAAATRKAVSNMAPSNNKQQAVDLIEVASQERDLRADIRATGADPDREHEGGSVRDGDLDAVRVMERSLGEGWDAAFVYAKQIGNTNKAACVFADSNYEAFSDGTPAEFEAQLKRVQVERSRSGHGA